MYGYGGPNPYAASNPFMSNPLLMIMMGMGNHPINPYEGNGLLHPVYISPMMMHKLEETVPPWEDPNLADAKEGNLECTKGATVSCMDSGKQVKTVSPEGIIKLKDIQRPEKISCFAGCAQVNPCNNNLYSSFIKSEHSCDGPSRYYYTCESFEEMGVFSNACAKHPDAGAKIDAPKAMSRYKLWYKKVMKNRLEGAGREIMFDDSVEEPGLGMSVGEGNAGNAPITDEELGNKVDPNQYLVGKEGLGRGATGAHISDIDDDYNYNYDYDEFEYEYEDEYENEEEENNDYEYEDQYEFEQDFNDYISDYDSNYNMENEELYDYNFNANDEDFNDFNDGYYVNNIDSMESNHDKIETMIMGVWGIMISVIFICLCCIIVGVCGLLLKNMRKKLRENKHKKYLDDMRFVDLSDNDDDDDISDILNDDEQENMHLNNNDKKNNKHRNNPNFNRNRLLNQDSIA